MIIEKSFKGEDNQIRKWIYDTDNNTVYLSCYAKDLRDRRTIKISMKSAQELIDECSNDM